MSSVFSLASLRDQFIYFSLFLSVPSLVLYCAQIWTIVRRQQFHNSFYGLFTVRAITDLVYVLDSFFGYRLPVTGMGGAFLFGLYASFPSWALGTVYGLGLYAFLANNLSTAFILLNRLTAITMPLAQEKLWKRLFPVAVLVTFGVPFGINYAVFSSDYSLQGNASAFSISLNVDAISNYISNANLVASIVFLTVCLLTNLATWFAYKRSQKTNTGLVNEAQQRIERKLLVYSLITLVGHVLIALMMITIYVYTSLSDYATVLALYSQYPWVMDSGTVVLSSWLLLWASKAFRDQFFVDWLPTVVVRKCCSAQQTASVGTIRAGGNATVQVRPAVQNLTTRIS